jgi:hypothetical protein
VDEEQIKLEARLIAIEHLIINLYRITYDLAGASDETVEAVHKRALAELEQETFQGTDPALSDLWAAEIRDAVSKLLTEISATRRAAKK